jgi:hypothetical protein
MPSVNRSKYKQAKVFHSVGIAIAEQELRRERISAQNATWS